MTLFQAGLQALHFAAKSGHLEVACELLKNGASVNASSLVSSILSHRPFLSSSYCNFHFGSG